MNINEYFLNAGILKMRLEAYACFTSEIMPVIRGDWSTLEKRMGCVDTTNRSEGDIARESHLRILLIEDSDTDAFIVQSTLLRYMNNAVCTRAATFSAGEDLLKKGGMDIVLLDLGLPDTSSPADTYAQIKKWTGLQPVVIMTKLSDCALARVMVHEGAVDFINKDIISKHPQRLSDALNFSLARHQHRQNRGMAAENAVQQSKEKDTKEKDAAPYV